MSMLYYRNLASCLTIVACGLALLPASTTLGQDALTVIEFDQELDGLAVPRNLFGIFRDDQQAPRVQFIQESFSREKLPSGTEMGFLRLTYALNGPGTYNGFWLKTRSLDDPDKEADWSAYKNGALILRVRKGDPCTNVFKFEIKTSNGKKVYPAYIRLGVRHLEEIEKNGYADVILPLSAVVDSQDPLTNVSELVVILEEARLTEKRGNLLIGSLRLVKNLPRS